MKCPAFPLVRTKLSTWSTGVTSSPKWLRITSISLASSDRQDRPAALEMGEEAVAIAGQRDGVPERIDDAGLLVFEQDRLDSKLGSKGLASFSPMTREVRYGSPIGTSQPAVSKEDQGPGPRQDRHGLVSGPLLEARACRASVPADQDRGDREHAAGAASPADHRARGDRTPRRASPIPTRSADAPTGPAAGAGC